MVLSKTICRVRRYILYFDLFMPLHRKEKKKPFLSNSFTNFPRHWMIGFKQDYDQYFNQYDELKILTRPYFFHSGIFFSRLLSHFEFFNWIKGPEVLWFFCNNFRVLLIFFILSYKGFGSFLWIILFYNRYLIPLLFPSQVLLDISKPRIHLLS